MQVLITAGVRLLEFMFVLGSIGSALVLVLSAIEDLEMLLKPDRPSTR